MHEAGDIVLILYIYMVGDTVLILYMAGDIVLILYIHMVGDIVLILYIQNYTW